MNRALTIVKPSPPTVQERVAAAQAEARQAVAEHLTEFAEAAESFARLAQEVADGGDIYAPGIRDLARRMGERTNADLATLQLLAERQGMAR
jgi:hypothetical protein